MEAVTNPSVKLRKSKVPQYVYWGIAAFVFVVFNAWVIFYDVSFLLSYDWYYIHKDYETISIIDAISINVIMFTFFTVLRKAIWNKKKVFAIILSILLLLLVIYLIYLLCNVKFFDADIFKVMMERAYGITFE